MPANKRTSVTLRPVSREDEALIFDIYASTRADEMAQTGWDDAQRHLFLKMQFAAQQQHYSTRYPAAEHLIILSKAVPVGRLYVARSGEEIRILDIALLPEHRNRGTGSSIIKNLMDESAKSGKPVRIYVESYSRALQLFERLGFSQVEQTGFHYLMQWQSANQ